MTTIGGSRGRIPEPDLVKLRPFGDEFEPRAITRPSWARSVAVVFAVFVAMTLPLDGSAPAQK